jgi:hypothetical protein
MQNLCPDDGSISIVWVASVYPPENPLCVHVLARMLLLLGGRLTIAFRQLPPRSIPSQCCRRCCSMMATKATVGVCEISFADVAR